MLKPQLYDIQKHLTEKFICFAKKAPQAEAQSGANKKRELKLQYTISTLKVMLI